MTRFACLLLAALAVTPLSADEPQDTPAPDQIDRWVKQLDADSFDLREAATEALVEAGKPAVDKVAEAAEGDSLEVTNRAIKILNDLYNSGDEAAAKAAEDALKKLAESDNRSAARRAKAIVAPPQPPAPAQPRVGVPRIIQLRAANINGNRKIAVEKDGKKIEIDEKASGEIKVTITEKVEGKEQTKKYEAKDADDLKKKHPKIYKLYKEHAGQGGGNIVIGNIQIGAAGGAVPLAPARVLNPQQQKQAADAVKEAQEQLDDLASKLRKLAADGAKADDLKELADQIEAAREKLDGAKEVLEPKQNARPAIRARIQIRGGAVPVQRPQQAPPKKAEPKQPAEPEKES